MVSKKLIFGLLILLFSTPVFAGELEILKVVNESTIPSTIYAGDLVTINFDVLNSSTTGRLAEEIKISIELNTNDFEVIKESETISKLNSKSTKTVSLRFKAKESVLPGTYNIPIKLEYSSGSNKIEQIEEISFSVSSCDTLKIEDIKLSNFQPHLGDELIVSATINNSCSSSARNVGVELIPKTNTSIEPFIVTSGTTKKIGDIDPSESKKVEFSININDKVDVQTYAFALKSTCDVCSATENSFSFSVLGRPELVFSNIEFSVDTDLGNDKQLMQGNTFVLSIQLDNIGEEKAKAVDVSVDFGEGITGAKKSFLGNIDNDDSEAAIFNLGTMLDAEPGEVIGIITINYIDELGNEQTLVEEYSLFIEAAPPTNPIVYILILILLAVVLAMVYFVAKFIFRQLALRQQSR